MMKFLLLISMTFLWASHSLATEPFPLDPPHLSLSLANYKITGTQPLSWNGLNYTAISLSFEPKVKNNGLPVESYLAIANIMTTGAAAYGVIRWNPRQDKVRHFLAGYVVGNIANGTLQLLLPENMKHRRLYSALSGFGAGSLIGVAKEVYDSKFNGIPSVKDALVTALGAGFGTLTITFDLQKAFRKKP